MNISATAVRFDDSAMWVDLSDGRTLGVPLAWFPRLLQAKPAERALYTVSRTGLHWEGLDEDISVAGLLEGRSDQTRAETSKGAGDRRLLPSSRVEGRVDVHGTTQSEVEESKVANKRDYHVTPNREGGWDVRREESERSSGHFGRKSEAMDRGRDLARTNRTELVEHGKDGRIRDTDSYGRDPNPPKDNKH